MSTLNVANIQSLSTSTLPVVKNSAGTEVGRYVRAFCRINGTGTASITSDFNVSSITDKGVGDYIFTFENALPDANYAYTIGHSGPVNTHHCHVSTYQHAPTTTSIRLGVFRDESSSNRADDSRLCVAIF
jgi:hypothetical protein